MATPVQAPIDITQPAFAFSQLEWAQTPPAVQTGFLKLHQQVEQLTQQVEVLQARLDQNSDTSSKPPSSDSPYRKRKRSTTSGKRHPQGKRGGQKGHPGSGPILLEPTDLQHVLPEPCPCGQTTLVSLEPFYTHQEVELPPIRLQVTHFVLHQGQCGGCGRQLKAQVPSAHPSGYGPRLSALIGELSAIHRSSRRLVQDFCHSVLNLPISLGAIQKILDRTSQAIWPHYQAIATIARQAPVGYIDETPWYCQNALQWLWTMATDTATLYLIHPHRSKDAFGDLIAQWQGILVSDGYGVYQNWGHGRQTCLAHLIRTARGLAQRRDPQLAACGQRALKELQCLCQMAKAPPTGGYWKAWYACFCRLINQYHESDNEAGRLARRLHREMASLWLFLIEHGVETTNNRAERALRFGVLWRKGFHGTDSDKGNRWVERSLSLRQTCRQLGQSTYTILVDALTSFFAGRQPDLAWLH